MQNFKFDSIFPLLLMLIAMCYGKAAVAQEVILKPIQENCSMPMAEQNPKAWAMSRLKRISGHKVGGYFGGGIIPSSGYSPWTKGNPGDGLSWQLEYEWTAE